MIYIISVYVYMTIVTYSALNMLDDIDEMGKFKHIFGALIWWFLIPVMILYNIFED